jgi:hypothetical protein
MRPGNHERIPTVSEAVREATAIVDPEGAEVAVRALYEAYEDDDRPATAAEDLPGELLSAAEGIDGGDRDDGDDAPVYAAVAAAVWLSTNPGQGDDHDLVLREGTRVLFKGNPPQALDTWLSARGVKA